MECKTHIVCANTLALAFMRPDSVSSLLVCMGAATIGGTICDIDVSDRKSNKYVKLYSIVTIIGIVLLSFLELRYNLGVNNWINHNSSYFRIITCFISLLVVCYYGYLKPHRSFLHSFLGMVLLFILVYIALGDIVIPFMIGVVSHVILDLFNKRGLWLFYPLKKKVSLKLCFYNGEVNYILFNIFIVLLIIELMLFDSF